MTKPTFHSLYEEGIAGHKGSTTYLLCDAGMRPAPLEDCDIIVFNGGADIATSIYNEIPLYRGIPAEPSRRDKEEVQVFNQFKTSRKLKLGICRGAQLLNCLNGGSLWQDVNNHGSDHIITLLEDGRRIMATSTHHQMMRPNPDTAQIIAVSHESTSKVSEKDNYPYGSYLDDRADTEIVYYPATHSLCIQGHPEYVPGSAFAVYCLGLINYYMNEVSHAAA